MLMSPCLKRDTLEGMTKNLMQRKRQITATISRVAVNVVAEPCEVPLVPQPHDEHFLTIEAWTTSLSNELSNLEERHTFRTDSSGICLQGRERRSQQSCSSPSWRRTGSPHVRTKPQTRRGQDPELLAGTPCMHLAKQRDTGTNSQLVWEMWEVLSRTLRSIQELRNCCWASLRSSGRNCGDAQCSVSVEKHKNAIVCVGALEDM